MANQVTSSWEQAILNKLTNNGERIAVVERDLSEVKKDLSEVKQDLSEVKQDLSEVKEITKKIESLLSWLKWIGGAVVAIALSLIANFVYSVIS